MAAQTLAGYTTQVQRLLHDSSFQFWTQAELTDYINAGRNRVVRDTACVRLIQVCNLSANLEVYPFGGVTGAVLVSGGSNYNSAPNVAIVGGTGQNAQASCIVQNGSVTQVNVTNPGTGYSVLTPGAVAPTIQFTGGGGSGANFTATVLDAQSIDCIGMSYMQIGATSRYALYYRPFRYFNAWIRYNQSNTGPPVMFSVYAYTSVYVRRVPDQPYVAEFDTVVLPNALAGAVGEVEQIPYIFSDPVQYYACYLAKMKFQQQKSADEYMQRYKQSASAVLASVMTKRTASEYYAP